VPQAPEKGESSPKEASPLFNDREEGLQFYRDDSPVSDDDLGEEELEASEMGNGGLISNFQEKFEEILENNEDVEDAIELNEKFLADHLGVPSE
jgi:hypothetical protein